MFKKIIVILLSITFSGCMTAPKNNAEFAKIKDLHLLAGTYKNKGDPKGRLSWLIFSENKTTKIPHESIELIQVTISGKTFSVNAIENGCIVHNEKFTYGKDFKISNGEIEINKEISLLGPEVVGPVYHTTTIGIDTKGHGKSKNSGGVIGLYGLFVPVIIVGSEEVRYLRTNENKTYAKCKSS